MADGNWMRELICQSAERKSYGIKPSDAICYDDESNEALWFWEISNVTLLPMKV